MASTLRVPEPYVAPLARLRDLPEEDAARLMYALREAPPYLQVGQLAERAEAALTADAKADARSLLVALLSLRGQFRSTSVDELSLLLSESPDLLVEQSEQRATFRTRIRDVLGLEALRTTGNAIDVQTQHDRNYQSARIFTDIRPLYGDRPTEPPTGAVVIQMLQIETWDRQGGSESLYIALDQSDLAELKGVVDRALDKSEGVRKVLETAGLQHFQLDEGTL